MNISERVREERAVRQRNAEISLGRRQELPRTVTDADLEEAVQLFTHYPGDVHESLRLAIDFALRQGTTAPASVPAVSEPVAWRHSRTLMLYDSEDEVPLADGDEWAEPLYTSPPAPATAIDRTCQKCGVDCNDPACTCDPEDFA